MRHSISRRLAVLMATAAFTIGIPLGVVIAGASFNDVPSSNPFHDDIVAIANAGVTTGCGGGNYCPKDYVTREQMAAFMNRLGALQSGKTPVVNAAELDGNASSDFVMHGQQVTVQVDPTTMVARYPSQDTVEGRDLGHGGVYLNQASAGGGMVAGVQVPVGAVLKSITAYFDDSASGDITVLVEVIDMTAGNFDSIGLPLTSTGTSGYQSRYALLENHVMLSSQSLAIRVSGATDTSHLFYGASITYLMP